MKDPGLFVLTVLVILGVPGPTNTLLAASGAARGFQPSLVLLAAEGAGYLISIISLGLVLGPIVAAVPALGIGLRVLVAAYLVLLAAKLWGQGSFVESRSAKVSPRHVFVATLLNPKAVVLALGVMPFGSADVWVYLLGFSAMLAIIGAGWILVGVGIERAARSAGIAHLIQKAAAVVLSMFALFIAMSPLLGELSAHH